MIIQVRSISTGRLIIDKDTGCTMVKRVSNELRSHQRRSIAGLLVRQNSDPRDCYVVEMDDDGRVLNKYQV